MEPFSNCDFWFKFCARYYLVFGNRAGPSFSWRVEEIWPSLHACDEASRSERFLSVTTFSSSRRSQRPESSPPLAQRLGRNREPCCKPSSCPRGSGPLVWRILLVALCTPIVDFVFLTGICGALSVPRRVPRERLPFR